MPAKLERCVKHVQDQGKDKNSAYAICSKSTGWVKSGKHTWKKKQSKTAVKTTKVVTEGAVARIEQLLESSKPLIESYFDNEEDFRNKYRKGVYSSVTLDPTAIGKIWKYLNKVGLPMQHEKNAHVTVIYSRTRPRENPIAKDINGTVNPIGFGLFGKGSKNEPYVLVLKVDSPALQKAHQDWKKQGLKPTYSTYEPHLTLVLDLNRLMPGLHNMTEQKKKALMAVFDKMLPELPKNIRIHKHTLAPL